MQVKEQLKHVVLSDIKVIKDFNVRSKDQFKGPAFNELVESIREQGILQPVLLRPNENGFELIAGERRIRAAEIVAKANGGIENYDVPAIIRNLTDQEATELMLTENIQRQDLSPLEEAQGFKRYLNTVEGTTLDILAERCGKPSSYVRKHVVVLALPKEILEAWNEGKLAFGHLEQFSRVEPDVALGIYTRMSQHYQGIGSVGNLKNHINGLAPRVNTAKFDVKKAGCTTCHNNSNVQKTLFDREDTEDLKCMNVECFAEKQHEYLTANWKKSDTYKEHKTIGFEFHGQIERDSYNAFSHFDGAKLKKECLTCNHFKSVVRLDGYVYQSKVCFGEKACFEALEKDALKDPKTQAALDMEAKKERTAVRAQKHGMNFREKHFETAIPAKFDIISAQTDKALQLALIAMLNARPKLHEVMAKKLDLGNKEQKAEDYYYFRMNDVKIIKLVEGLKSAEVRNLLKELALDTIMDNGFSANGRFKVADFVGVDLEKEWVIDEEYLKAKQKSEILAIYSDKKFGISERPEVVKYLAEKLYKAGKTETCKKTELIDLFLKSGTDLVGIVPAEILKSA